MKLKPTQSTAKRARVRPFTEYTYTDGQSEVMAHHDSKTDKIVRLYTYAKDAPGFDACENENGKPVTPFPWQIDQNPGFLHLEGAAMRRFVREFIDSGDLICTERENEA